MKILFPSTGKVSARLSLFGCAVAVLICTAPVDGARSTETRQHTVRRGETLGDIARHYGVSVADLRRWSGLKGDRILVGQKLTVRKKSTAEWYVVRRGDNLTRIAARFGISPGELRRLNRLDGSVIHPGQKLRLGPAPSGIYIVRRGDTLSEIAAASGVPARELRKLNNLRGDRIGAGQRLRLRAAESDPEEVTEYVVRRGDSLSKIARRFDVAVGFLKQLNGLKSDRIRPGQKLRLRASAVDEGIHIVRRGENLTGIARRYGISLAVLRDLNGIEGDRILVGQKLRLRATPSARHIVERGDALWEIARAYSMSVAELKKLNGLTSDRIYPGQELALSPEKSRRHGTYMVTGGDNLTEIARLHQMSVSELKRINNLRSSVIHPGQSLKVRPLVARRERLELADFDWADLQVAPRGVRRIDVGNGPYFGRRPKANRQRGREYYEGHPASPLKTYRKASKLWKQFERAVGRAGRLSNRLEGWNIVLDPGHGGLDPGAVVKTTDGKGSKLYVVEDEYVHDIALRAYVLLRLHGAKVTMTLLSPNHLIRGSAPPSQTFVNEKNEVYNSYALNKANTRNQWPRGSRRGLDARVRIAREAFAGTPKSRRIFLSFHADIDKKSPRAPLVLYYESRDGRRRDPASRTFAKSLLPALGAGSRMRGQGLRVLRNNPAAVKVLVELRNLAYLDHAWALRFEQLRQRDAEKVVRGVLDWAGRKRLAGR